MYAGMKIEHELERAGRKKQKGEGQLEAARARVMRRYFGETTVKPKFADPAAFFAKAPKE